MDPHRSPTDTAGRVRERYKEKEPLSSHLSKQCRCLCPHSIPVTLSPHKMHRQTFPSNALYLWPHFSPVSPSPHKMHLQERTRGESIPHRHPIATWHMPLKNAPVVLAPLHLILCFLPALPPDPLNSLRSEKKTCLA